MPGGKPALSSSTSVLPAGDVGLGRMDRCDGVCLCYPCLEF